MAVNLTPKQLEKVSRLRNGDVIDGKYQLKEIIGVGGMSIVWRAVDLGLQKDWAIKETRKDKGRQSVQDNEIEVMKKLDHPGLPHIVGKSQVDGSDLIIMDLVEGKSLGDILKEEGAQDEKKVIEWALQICDALYYLHSQNPPIIYKDMKPDNVMVRGENRETIKIIDLGIAMETGKQQKAGTPAYQPPEQREGYADQRSDIYALGVTMHYLVTGVKPKIGSYAPIRDWNPMLSEGLERIINKCVEIDPNRRYKSMKGLMNDLKHPEFITSGYRKKQKQKMGAFLGALGVSALLIIGGFGLNIYADYQDNSDYDRLVNTETGKIDAKLDNYVTAMQLIPDRPDAYIRYLEACREGKSFSKDRADIFEKYYSKNEKELNRHFNNNVAKMNLLAAENYLQFSEGSDLGENIRVGNGSALQYLTLNHDEIEKGKEIDPDISGPSETYYTICKYYKDYLLNEGDGPSGDEAKEAMTNVLAEIKEELDAIGIDGAVLSPQRNLFLYNTTLGLLKADMDKMVAAGISLNEQIVPIVSQITEQFNKLKESGTDETKDNVEDLTGYVEGNLKAVNNDIEKAKGISTQQSSDDQSGEEGAKS